MTTINAIVAHENEYWSQIFDEANKQTKLEDKLFSSFWWEDYYREIVDCINTNTNFNSNWKVLEAGSGSGKSSILLGKNIHRTFLDISDKALEFAKHLAKKFQAQNIKFIKGNILNMPFDNQSFDLVWNIGVVEHYEKAQIQTMLQEMIRTTNINGVLAIGVPNFWTGATLKAWFLKKSLFSFIKGYRLDSEKFYSQETLLELVNKACQVQNRTMQSTEIRYFGNPLFMESPKWLLLSAGNFIAKLIPRSKFLTLIIIKLN